MKCTANFVIFIFCFRLVVTISENGLRQNAHDTFKRRSNSIHTSRIPYNTRHYPGFSNYANSFKRDHNKRNDPYFLSHSQNSPLAHMNDRNQNSMPFHHNDEHVYKTAHDIEYKKHKIPISEHKQNMVDEVNYDYNTDIRSKNKITDVSVNTLNIENILTNPDIRNHYLASNKKYMVIHPNGIVENVDNLESIVSQYPNYVLVHAGDISTNDNKTSIETNEPDSNTDFKNTSDMKSNEDARKNNSVKFKIHVEKHFKVPIENTFKNDENPDIVSLSMKTDSPLVVNSPTTIIEIKPKFPTFSNNSKVHKPTKKDENIESAAIFDDVTSKVRPEAKNRDNIVHQLNIKENITSESKENENSSNFLLKLLEDVPSFFKETGARIKDKPHIDSEVDVTYDSFNEAGKNNIQNPDEENTHSNFFSNSVIDTITQMANNLRNLFISSKEDKTNPINGSNMEKNYTEKVDSIAQVPVLKGDSYDGLNDISMKIDRTNLEQNNPYPTNLQTIDKLHSTAGNVLHKLDDTQNPNSFNTRFENEKLSQLEKTNDTNMEKDTISENNLKQIYKEEVLNIVPIEIPEKIIKDNDLSNDHETNENYKSTVIVDDVNDVTEKPTYFKIDKEFWEKLKNNEIPYDVVYFFQMEDEPVIERETKTVIYPNGTSVTYETTREYKEDKQPIIINNVELTDEEILNL